MYYPKETRKSITPNECFGDALNSILKFKEGEKTAEVINGTKKLVTDLSKGLTTSQLRNIFSKVKKCKTIVDLQLIRPQLAYISARQQKPTPELKSLFEFFDGLIQKVNTLNELDSFILFFESYVAYHKFYIGEKK